MSVIIRDSSPASCRVTVRFLSRICAVVLFLAASGCAHYAVNQAVKQCDPEGGYRGKNFRSVVKEDDLLIMLTFSGGGTRAAAFSYGVLETLRDTEVPIRGRKKRLLDEVDFISGVSGGSFTAGYYGLFGERIFEDFETRFLKKNIQGDLIQATLFNPVNWVRLTSGYYGRSDLAEEYYDKNVFNGGTFGDILARKGPLVVINATDMRLGARFSFTQDTFDAICTDLLSFPVARACAASSAVPVVLSSVTLRNYAGSCGYNMPEVLRQALQPPRDVATRRFDLANSLLPFLDSKNKPYFHLVDGGVADNLGLRALLERVTIMGSAWTTMQYAGMENVRKIVFVVVNAETEISDKWDRLERIPPFSIVLDAYSSTAISRYNMDSIALLQESFPRWAEEIRQGRCGSAGAASGPGSCGDIEFYLVEVRFDALDDEAERSYFKQLPTSFSLEPEQVDRLRDAARRILTNSRDFQKLIRDLQ